MNFLLFPANFSLFFPDLQYREECLLRNIDLADALHPLLAFLLLLEQLALAADVAAVAFGEDVFAPGADRFAGDDLRSGWRPGSRLQTAGGDPLAHRGDPEAAALAGESRSVTQQQG